jgi:hypothetical protein
MDKKILYYKYGDRNCLNVEGNIKLTNYKNILKDSIKKHDIYIKLDINDKYLKDKMLDFGKIGFFYPHVVLSENNPFILVKLIKDNFEQDFSEVLPEFCNIIIQMYNDYISQNKISCIMHIRISKSCIEQLYKLVYINSDNNKPQKEFAGNLNLQSLSAKNKIIWKIGLNKELKDLDTGKEDNVEGPNEPFTFHTHPYKTYKDFKVKYAWPSKTDYESIWTLIVELDGLCHFVATVEGIYCVSINEKWSSRIDVLKKTSEKQKKEILKHYQEEYVQIDSTDKYTPNDYIYNVNKRVKTLDLPFIIQFYGWKNSEKEYKIHVPVINNNNNEISCKCFNLKNI